MIKKSLKDKEIQSVEKVEINTDFIYEFNAEQLMTIEETKQEIKAGKIQSDDDVKKEIEKWINK
jgi:hypothetical protein